MDASGAKRSHHSHHHHHPHPGHGQGHFHHHCHFICHHGHAHFICHHSVHSPALAAAPPPTALQHPQPAAAPCGPNSEAFPPNGGSLAAQMTEEQDYDDEQIGEDYDDFEEEPIFILTDEWREFFAKSEAKRKLEKKKAKKKGDN